MIDIQKEIKPYVEQCYLEYSSFNLTNSRSALYQEIDHLNNCPEKAYHPYLYGAGFPLTILSAFALRKFSQCAEPNDGVPFFIGLTSVGAILIIAGATEQFSYTQHKKNNCLTCEEKLEAIAYNEQLASNEIQNELIASNDSSIYSNNFELCASYFDPATTTIYDSYDC